MTAEDARRDAVAKYVVIGLAALVFAIGVVIVLLPDRSPDITYRTLSVELGDPEKVVVTFEVTKAPLASAECQVTATGEKRDIVDRLTGIRIGPTPGERTTRHTVTVPTEQRATAATVTYCAITRTR